MKPATETSKRLMNLLYDQTASKLQLPEVMPQVYSKSSLYLDLDKDEDGSTSPSNGDDSWLEFYHSSQSRKIPARDALLKCSPKFQSNIMSFQCPNSYITKNDFQNMLPRKRYQTYNLNPVDDFEVIKKRDDNMLSFQNEYLFIFKNQLSACVYQLETQNKLLNGMPMNLNFEPIEVITRHLLPKKLQQQPNHSRLVDEIIFLNSSIVPLDRLEEQFSNYDLLMDMLRLPEQRRSLLVHNWPFGVKLSTIKQYFRNFGLDPVHPRTVIESNIARETNIILLHFNKETDALRFMRNFHGRDWSMLQEFSSTREKVFYQPLLCETL
ncbi:uncharacterized protein LODBEIA_P52600 [Lodderomyces beijingensis]|uniref:RRM domain-containing protein n=1 Tax=Lodderomyces beijingensis TaxID=1775926 RepID=A0ABP0ZSB9_9ASCO